MNIKPFGSAVGSCQIRSGFGPWCQALLPKCCYDLLTAEFGTYPFIQVLKALRDENRSYWWGDQFNYYDWTKNQLVETFSLKSQIWRKQCLAEGLSICMQALNEAE
jgi:hypothetical protein